LPANLFAEYPQSLKFVIRSTKREPTRGSIADRNQNRGWRAEAPQH